MDMIEKYRITHKNCKLYTMYCTIVKLCMSCVAPYWTKLYTVQVSGGGNCLPQLPGVIELQIFDFVWHTCVLLWLEILTWLITRYQYRRKTIFYLFKMIPIQKISFQLFFINLLQSQDGTHVHSPLHIGFSNYKTATNYLIGSLSRDISSTLFGA